MRSLAFSNTFPLSIQVQNHVNFHNQNNKKMENIQESVIEQLNYLIKISEDGKNGYETAAKDVEDAHLKTLFTDFARERASYTSQLQLQVNSLNGDAEESGGPVGAMHRLWMDIKSAFSADTGIVEACITGEEAAVSAYTKVLANTTFTQAVRQLLMEQMWGIERALVSLKAHIPEPA